MIAAQLAARKIQFLALTNGWMDNDFAGSHVIPFPTGSKFCTMYQALGFHRVFSFSRTLCTIWLAQYQIICLYANVGGWGLR